MATSHRIAAPSLPAVTARSPSGANCGREIPRLGARPGRAASLTRFQRPRSWPSPLASPVITRAAPGDRTRRSTGDRGARGGSRVKGSNDSAARAIMKRSASLIGPALAGFVEVEQAERRPLVEKRSAAPVPRIARSPRAPGRPGAIDRAGPARSTSTAMADDRWPAGASRRARDSSARLAVTNARSSVVSLRGPRGPATGGARPGYRRATAGRDGGRDRPTGGPRLRS